MDFGFFRFPNYCVCFRLEPFFSGCRPVLQHCHQVDLILSEHCRQVVLLSTALGWSFFVFLYFGFWPSREGNLVETKKPPPPIKNCQSSGSRLAECLNTLREDTRKRTQRKVSAWVDFDFRLWVSQVDLIETDGIPNSALWRKRNNEQDGGFFESNKSDFSLHSMTMAATTTTKTMLKTATTATTATTTPLTAATP